MALSSSLGQVVTGKIAGQFKKFVNGIGKQKLDLPSLGDFGKLGKPADNGSTVKNFSFPLDVVSGPGQGNQGHYIMFFINEQQNAKISFKGRKDGEAQNSMFADDASASASSKKEKAARAIPDFIRTFDGKTGQFTQKSNANAIKQQVNQADPMGNVGGAIAAKIADKKRAIVVKRAPTKRLKTAITMFMPGQINTKYGAEYNDTSVGLLTQEALDIYNKGIGTKEGRDSLRRALTENLPEALTLLLQGTLGALPGLGGLRDVQGMQTGEIISDRLELAFRGVSKRSFTYTFKMIPKSKEEAQEIRNIIFMFKSNMLPEFTGGVEFGRRMVVPNTFDIQYMYRASENDYLHKIGTCVLKDLDVTYGGDKFRTYTATDDGAPPSETTIGLTFSELELVTREAIHEGF